MPLSVMLKVARFLKSRINKHRDRQQLLFQIHWSKKVQSVQKVRNLRQGQPNAESWLPIVHVFLTKCLTPILLALADIPYLTFNHTSEYLPRATFLVLVSFLDFSSSTVWWNHERTATYNEVFIQQSMWSKHVQKNNAKWILIQCSSCFLISQFDKKSWQFNT